MTRIIESLAGVPHVLVQSFRFSTVEHRSVTVRLSRNIARDYPGCVPRGGIPRAIPRIGNMSGRMRLVGREWGRDGGHLRVGIQKVGRS
jgi:hypothetical protein